MDSLNKVPAKSRQAKTPLVIKGKNASGKIIEAYIPAGVLPKKDPGLAIAESLRKFPAIQPTSVGKPE